MLTVTAAYAAGFFDGEGCVYIRRLSAPSNYKGRIYYRVVAAIGNCDFNALQAVKNTFGGSLYEVNQRKVKEKDWSRQYRWSLSCMSAVDFLRAIEPYSIIKRSYIHLALRFAETIVQVPYGRRDEAAQAALYEEYCQMRAQETRTRHFKKLK